MSPADTTSAAPAEKLGRRAMRGSLYEIASFGAGNAIRLLGNLVLTRLLFPEAFGAMAILAIFNQGLVMLSDVGISPGVVQSPDGDDPLFLDTAWTMHVVRGSLLFVLAAVLAWPVAWLYEVPSLWPLLVVGSSTVLLASLESTSMMTLLRRVDSRRIMVVELSSQVFGLLVTIAGAYWFRSVWALVLGGVAGTALKTAMSHFFVNVGYRNRLRWSREAADSIVRFGKWIFLSSAVTFFAQQIDRIFLGKFFGLAELGIYTVAATFADLGSLVVTRLTHQILFPSFSKVYRDDPSRLKRAYYKARLALDGLTLPGAGVLFALAPWLIALLYDSRYAQAGWMLQILVVRVIFTAIVVPCETCLFSMGKSHYGFVKSMCRLAWMLVALPLGYHWGGIRGLVWATALSELPALLVLLPVFAREKLLDWRRELVAPVLFATVALAALGVGQLLARL
ncbi:MAG TPA: oligosaccharide flippase family protein [Polyangiaceae bacterium]|nr:oligosaccharide flippase family protein [Polyangiaceae bacterium]